MPKRRVAARAGRRELGQEQQRDAGHAERGAGEARAADRHAERDPHPDGLMNTIVENSTATSPDTTNRSAR